MFHIDPRKSPWDGAPTAQSGNLNISMLFVDFLPFCFSFLYPPSSISWITSQINSLHSNPCFRVSFLGTPNADTLSRPQCLCPSKRKNNSPCYRGWGWGGDNGGGARVCGLSLLSAISPRSLVPGNGRWRRSWGAGSQLSPQPLLTFPVVLLPEAPLCQAPSRVK